jgi:hypothetical protein
MLRFVSGTSEWLYRNENDQLAAPHPPSKMAAHLSTT